MADSSKPKSGGGCLGRLLVLFLLAAGGGLLTALFFITRPQNLSDIGGYGADPQAGQTRDMKAVLKNSIDRGYPVTLTEIEINHWLGRTLSLRQGGLLAKQVSLERVWVRLLDGYAEVVMERRIMDRPFTLSMFLRIEQLEGAGGVKGSIQLDGGPYHVNLPRPPRGGRFGQLVVPQGFLHLVMPAYRKLGALFLEEKELGFDEMSRIRIEKGRLVLDPREPSMDPLGLPQTF